MKKNISLMIIYFIIISVLTIIICTAFGSADIKIIDSFKILFSKIILYPAEATAKERIILNIRLPRVLLAFFSGGFLSLCGCTVQSIFKNPLADPYLLGTSSGASLGATIGIILGFSSSFLGLSGISLLAFFFAMLTTFLVFKISSKGFLYSSIGLLLAGIVIGQLFSAITSLIMILYQSQMKQIIFWTFGSFAAKSWKHLMIVLPLGSVLTALIIYFSNDLDLMLLSDDEALSLGCDVRKRKKQLLLINCLLTALVVSVSGIIGFVGLIAPHVARLFAGPIHKKLLPFSFFIGANTLTICDTIARSVITSEIPVGIVTSLLGAPFFLFLFIKMENEEI